MRIYPAPECTHHYPAACACYEDVPCADCGSMDPVMTTAAHLYVTKHVYASCYPVSDGDLVCRACALERIDRMVDAAVSSEEARLEDGQRRWAETGSSRRTR